MQIPATLMSSDPAPYFVHHIGIDPGANGGLAWTSPLGDKSIALPDTLADTRNAIFDALNEQGFFTSTDTVRVRCCIEQPPKFVQAIPGSAVYVMARNFGQLEGILAAFRVSVTHVTPQNWQKAHGLGTSKGMSKTEWKNKLKARAQSLYPEEKVTLATADALLILNASVNRLI
jgi:hypothetical protein